MSVQPVKSITPTPFNLAKNKDEKNDQPHKRPFHTSSTNQTLVEKQAGASKNDRLYYSMARRQMVLSCEQFLLQNLRPAVHVHLYNVLIQAGRGDDVQLVQTEADGLKLHADKIRARLADGLVRLREAGFSDSDPSVDAQLGLQHVLGNALTGPLLRVELLIRTPKETWGPTLQMLEKSLCELEKIYTRLNELEQKPDNVRLFLFSEIKQRWLDERV